MFEEFQRFFDLATGSHNYCINMSVRVEQSKKVAFGEIKSHIDNSPRFQKYYPPDPNIRLKLRFAKNVIIMPGNCKETFPLGFNVLGGVMSEAAFYTETPGRDVAEEVFNTLHARIKNRFGEKGLSVMVSPHRCTQNSQFFAQFLLYFYVQLSSLIYYIITN